VDVRYRPVGAADGPGAVLGLSKRRSERLLLSREVEITGTALLVLLAGLFLRGRRALAGRILAVFVATGVFSR
jgi:hypothetical protein